MANYVNIKLKYTDEEIVGVLTKDEENCVVIEHPINIRVHAELGYYAKDWLLLSESNTAVLQRNDILHICEASKEAIAFYQEYVERVSDAEFWDEVEKHTEELEDVFTSMQEATEATKH